MPNIAVATVKFSLDDTKLKFADLPGNQLPINLAFKWSKNNSGEIPISQGLGWAFHLPVRLFSLGISSLFFAMAIELSRASLLQENLKTLVNVYCDVLKPFL